MKAEDVENYALAEYVLAEERRYGNELARLDVDFTTTTVLDLAAGPGTWTKLFAEAGSPLVVWSDRSELFLHYARAYLSGLEPPAGPVRYAVADFCAVPFRSASFDLVFCRLSLHHAPDEELALREMFRIIRPGGILALYAHTVGRVKNASMSPYKKVVHYLVPVFFELTGRKPVSALFHIQPLLMRRLRRAGFVVEAAERIDSEVVYYRLRKPAA